MNNLGPEFSFRGLPLCAEQESEIQHYIHQRLGRGLPPDVLELRSMLQDMLDPPIIEGFPESSEAVEPHADAERTAGFVDNCTDSVTAREERTAAREAEAMKHLGA